MTRLGASKNKKSPRATELSQVKKELKRVTAQLDSRDRELAATSEILRVIASSSTDLQPVLGVVAENAARLCDASDALIVRVDGNNHIPMASYGVLAPTHGITTNRESPAGRAILDRQTIHIRDLALEVETEFPAVAEFQKRFGHRTMTSKQSKTTSGGPMRYNRVYGQCLPHRYCVKASQLVRLASAARKSSPSPTSRSRFSRPSPIKR